MYVKASIPKSAEGAGAASIKKAEVILVDIEDVATEPARTLGDTVIATDYTFIEGAKAVGVYATPSSIALTEENNGEVDSRSLIKGVEYDHPGDSVAIANHTEAFLNKGVIAFVRECDGSDGRVRVVGSLCNPLYLQSEYSNNKDGIKRHFVWKQNQGDKFAIGTYSGELPALAPAPSANGTV